MVLSEKRRKKDLMVVPISKYSFKKALEEHFYAFPESYGRKKKKYIAFYQTRPIKAVTHYARVRNVKIKPLSDFSARDILLMFGHRAKKGVVVLELDPLIELETPIKGKYVQSCRYTSLDLLKEGII